MQRRTFLSILTIAAALGIGPAAAPRPAHAGACTTAQLWAKALADNLVLADLAKRQDGTHAVTFIVNKGKGTVAAVHVGGTAVTCYDGGDQTTTKGYPDHVWGCPLAAGSVGGQPTLDVTAQITLTPGGTTCDFARTFDTAKITLLPISNKEPNPHTGKLWGIGEVLLATFIYDAAWDVDGDGKRGFGDNCTSVKNPDQANKNGDLYGDACDGDEDGVIKELGDSCPATKNTDWTNTDGEGENDACDPDDDNDGIPDTTDNCPTAKNTDQSDLDKDGTGDACDKSMPVDTSPPTPKQDNLSDVPDGECAANEIYDAEDQQCYPDRDSDGDGLIDAKDKCNGVVDPSNACGGVILDKSTNVEESAADDGGGCSLLARARTRNGTGTMLCALVTLLAFALARQFRSKP